MNKLFFLFSLQTITLICFITSATAQTGLNIHIGKQGIDIRPDAFISYYQAPPDRASWLLQQNIPSSQWPLLFEIARAGNITLDRVWEVRRQQSNWQDVLNALNVPPSYFYYDVPAEQRLSPPYGRAYGYYRTPPTESVRWSDEDLFGLASVKYISDSTHRPAHEAVAIYQNRPHFIQTHDTRNVKQNYKQNVRQNHKQNHRQNVKQNHRQKHGKHKKGHGRK